MNSAIILALLLCLSYSPVFAEETPTTIIMSPLTLTETDPAKENTTVITNPTLVIQEERKDLSRLRLIPTYGQFVRGHSSGEIESNGDYSLMIETDLNNHFTVGLEGGASSTDILEMRKGTQWYRLGLGSIYTGIPVISFREIESERQQLEIYGKWNMLSGRSWKPFLGISLGVARESYQYKTAPQLGQTPWSPRFENHWSQSLPNDVSSLTQSYLFAGLKGGVQWNLSQYVGLYLEASYKKKMSDISQQQDWHAFPQQSLLAFDQKLLKQIAQDLIDQDLYTLKTGLSFSF